MKNLQYLQRQIFIIKNFSCKYDVRKNCTSTKYLLKHVKMWDENFAY